MPVPSKILLAGVINSPPAQNEVEGAWSNEQQDDCSGEQGQEGEATAEDEWHDDLPADRCDSRATVEALQGELQHLASHQDTRKLFVLDEYVVRTSTEDTEDEEEWDLVNESCLSCRN